MIKKHKYTLNSVLGSLELTHNPIGWDGANYVLKRDEKYEGVFFNYSLEHLEFIGNGYDYLKSLFEIEFFNLDCTIKYEKFNQFTQRYETAYEGILNGKTYKESSKNGKSISMKIGESSVVESVLSRADNIINYNDEKSISGVTLPAISDKYVELYISGQNIITENKGAFENVDTGHVESFIVGLWGMVTEGNNKNVYNVAYNRYGGNFKQIANGGWAYRTKNRTSKITIKIKGNVKITHNASFCFSIANILDVPLDSDGNPIATTPDWIDTPVRKFTISDTWNSSYVDKEIEIDMVENQALLIYSQIDSSNYYSCIITDLSLNYSISELPSIVNIDAIKPFNLFNRILGSITDNQMSFTSSILDTDYKDVLHFNGYMARQFSSEKSSFAISFKDLFESWKILANCAIGIDGDNISIEARNDFYKEDVILEIDNVKLKSWERTLDTKMIINSIAVGFGKQDYLENSGLEEFNNIVNYSTPITNNKSELKLITKLSDDGYGITFAIEKDSTKDPTSDSKYDKHNFILDSRKVYNTWHIQKNYSSTWDIKNIDQINRPINLNFSPARLLIRNSDKLTGVDKFSNDIKFTKAEVLNDLKTLNNSTDVNVVNECEDIKQTEIKSQLFSGFMLLFDWALSFSQYTNLKNNRYGLIKVLNPLTNKYHYGWIEKITLNKNNEASFILLEKNNSIVPHTANYMITDDGSYVVTDTLDKITVL